MILFHNANIITLATSAPQASALLVDDEKIVAVGGIDQILQQTPRSCKKIDMGGRTILPGMTDSHIHTLQYAQSLARVDCDAPTKQACLTRVQQRLQDSPPGTWILGHGWDQNRWQDGYGDRGDLDRLSDSHPIYLTSKSLHASWANSLAMRLAGITSSTADPAGGIVQRDVDGNPTGIFLDNAIPLLEAHIPPPSTDEVIALLQSAQEALLALGITAVHDFDRENCLMGLQSMNEADLLKIRFIKGIPQDFLQKAIDERLRTGDRKRKLEIGPLKLFADGALGPRTAALFEPYDNEPENLGLLSKTRGELFHLGRIAIENGISLAIHAIGDRALREVVLAYQDLILACPAAQKMNHLHRIEHVQLACPDDVRHMRELKLVASMQPGHAPADMHMARKYWGSRTRNAYALRSMVEAGVLSIYGSDAPVENPNPFHGIAAAVSRRSLGSTEPFHAEQAISLQQALEGYCLNPAVATNRKNETGQLRPGSQADFIVIDANPFAIEPIELYNIKVESSYIAGAKVFER